MSAVTALYDFENLIPIAVATSLSGTNFGSLTALHPLSDPKFQQMRPRVEVTYKHGGAVTPLRIAPNTVPDGAPVIYGRNSAWSGELSIHAITDADPIGKLTHSTYRAEVRSACALLLSNVNGITLTQHCLQSLVETGTTHGIRSNDGYEQTTITFHVDFSVQADAWQTLNGTN